MEIPSLGGPADLKSIRGCTGRPFCLPGIIPLPGLLLPDRGTPWNGCPGTQLAPEPTQSSISHSEPACIDTVQGQGRQGAGLVGCASMAHPDLVLGPDAPVGPVTCCIRPNEFNSSLNFRELLNSFGPMQHVTAPTQKHGLNLVILCGLTLSHPQIVDVAISDLYMSSFFFSFLCSKTE